MSSMLSNSKCKLSHYVRRAQILDVIRQRERVSRKQLVELTGLTPPVITRMTRELIEESIVEEIGVEEVKGHGRPEIWLGLSTSSRYILGLDLGAYEIKAVATNLAGQTLHRASCITPTEGGTKVLADTLRQTLKELVKEAGIKPVELEGIALCGGGLIDNNAGTIKSCNQPALAQINLRQLAHEAYPGVPVIVASSGSSRTLAEFEHARAASEAEDILTVHCGYGIGLSPLTGGKVAMGFSPVPKRDFGHITFDPLGPICRCGMTGCLEAYAGGWAIGHHARQQPSQELLALVAGDVNCITASEVCQAATRGDSACRSILTRAGAVLGKCLSTFAQYYAPSRIVFAGGLASEDSDLYFQSCVEAIERSMSPQWFARFEITRSQMDKYAAASGATRLLLNDRVRGPLDALVERIW